MRCALVVTILLLVVGAGVSWGQGDLIFADGFESGDVSAWSYVAGYQPLPVIDLRADVNRNGTIDLTDPTEDLDEDTWDADHGAIFLANLDDDLSACPTTGSDPELAACHDAADDVINGSSDLVDLARLEVVPWPAAPDDASAQIVLSSPGSTNVRVFKRTGSSFAFFDPSVQTLGPVELRTGVEFAIEATDIVRNSGLWNGFVDITLEVDAGTGPVGPYEDGSDTVRFRIAPVLFRHHPDQAETVYVTAFSYTSSVEFRADLSAAVSAAGISNPLAEFWDLGDQWTQDFFETAYMSMPAVGGQHTIHINFRSANYTGGGPLRESGRVVFTQLRGPDVAGAVQYDPAHPDWMDTLNSFGNLETIPPYDDGRAAWPLGRVVRGGTPTYYPDQSFNEMIDAQGMQPVIHVDTEFLLVAHIDETLSFLPTSSPRGWLLLAADVVTAWNSLVDAYNAGHGLVPMFVGKYWWGSVPAEIQIADVVFDQDIADANAWAAAEIANQIDHLSMETGLDPSEVVSAPFIFWEQSNWLVAYVPGVVNGVVLSETVFAAPDPHGPEIGGVDLFQHLLEQNLAVVGYTPAWIEDWDLYHRLDGEVHCGSNVTRAIPSQPWWEVAP